MCASFILARYNSLVHGASGINLRKRVKSQKKGERRKKEDRRDKKTSPKINRDSTRPQRQKKEDKMVFTPEVMRDHDIARVECFEGLTA